VALFEGNHRQHGSAASKLVVQVRTVTGCWQIILTEKLSGHLRQKAGLRREEIGYIRTARTAVSAALRDAVVRNTLSMKPCP
jgi:hypothetical protein